METSIVWFRRDLRLHDHEPLRRAQAAGRALCVLCVDPREFGTTPLGFPKTGPHRARFLRETVVDLRTNMRARGGELIVRSGRPEEILPALAARTGATRVFAHAEVCDEEVAVEGAVARALRATGVALEFSHGFSLIHPDDLPFAPTAVPDVFTHFRRAVEKDARVRTAEPAPTRMDPIPDGIEPGAIPTLEDLRLRATEADPRGALEFRGGESKALRRLEHYLWDTDHVARYKRTRNGLLGADYSTKFSPWLALGSLSPRRIHDEIRRYERERTKNDSTYWVIFELLWRDFFRLIAERHGNALFRPSGLGGEIRTWRRDRDALDRWIDGRTGDDFVDANLRELFATGFMSNRGRQNVASYLVHDLGIDWTWGAQWFESALIDYDVHVNWANWAYVAGVGTDPRGGRRFDTRCQAAKHDPRGDFVRHWLDDAGIGGIPESPGRARQVD